MDAGWSLETFKVCRVEGGQGGEGSCAGGLKKDSLQLTATRYKTGHGIKLAFRRRGCLSQRLAGTTKLLPPPNTLLGFTKQAVLWL